MAVHENTGSRTQVGTTVQYYSASLSTETNGCRIVLQHFSGRHAHVHMQHACAARMPMAPSSYPVDQDSAYHREASKCTKWACK
jgi:hypothetical protein